MSRFSPPRVDPKLAGVSTYDYTDDHEEEEEIPRWERAKANMTEPMTYGAEARFARRNPVMWAMARTFKGMGKKEAADLLQKVATLLKEGGQWEHGGGGATQGVYSMTPGSLHIPSGGLGGPAAFQSMVGMQMRPTLAGYPGMGGEGLVQSYRAMANGAPQVGW